MTESYKKLPKTMKHLLIDINGNNPVLCTEDIKSNEVAQYVANYLNAKQAELIEINSDKEAVFKVTGKGDFIYYYSFDIIDDLPVV